VTRRNWTLLLGVAAIALAIAATVLIDRAASEYDTQPVSFARTADPSQIVVIVTVGLGDEVVGKSIRQDDRSVTVVIRVRRASGNRPSLGVTLPYAVNLGAPLGSRVVLDPSGTPVPER